MKRSKPKYWNPPKDIKFHKIRVEPQEREGHWTQAEKRVEAYHKKGTRPVEVWIGDKLAYRVYPEDF